MGSGTWSRDSFVSYSTSMGRSVSSTGDIVGSYSNQEMFKERSINEALNPLKVLRECCNSDEHPNTVPVILALDVTGSMGEAAVQVAKQLNVLMTKLYEKVKDVEFLIMGIGDLAYDRYPIQASQFESDIRIAEQLDKIYFEFGGGGNDFESYTAAWYFGMNNTKLDCWEQGRKGLIITMGDELLNPYLSGKRLEEVLGCTTQGDVETISLYKNVSSMYDIYHINVLHGYHIDPSLSESFANVIGSQNVKSVRLDEVSETIENIVVDFAKSSTGSFIVQPDGDASDTSNGVLVTEEGIAW